MEVLVTLNNHYNWDLNTCTHAMVLTQSKSKTIITRQMCVISLIVFTDNYNGRSIIFLVHEIHYTKYMLLNYIGPISPNTC